jgi:hypothetical protein
VNEFQLIFRGADGEGDQTEYRFNDQDGHPKINGQLIVDGETYKIRGVDWLVKRDSVASDMPRFVCTLVVEAVGV